MIAQLDSLYIKIRPTKVINRLISYTFFEGRPVTTKGRWINHLVFSLFCVEKKLPQLKKVEKPVFVLGTGRSGTTVLGIILSMHRDVAFLNEPKAMWHSLCHYEDVIGNYSKGEARYRLSDREVTEDMKRFAHRLYGAYLAATCSKRVVDKYPELIFRIPFVKALFPDAKFLFLVRNGWDTIQSIEEWSTRYAVKTDNTVHDWWGVNNRKWYLLVDQIVSNDHVFSKIQNEVRNFTNQVDMAAVEWIVTMREGLSRLKQYPEAIRLVRYEDLVQHTEESLISILDFCELTPDNIFFKYATKTLHPTKSRGSIGLHPAIQPLFNDAMESLGYPVF
ncbi:MAG TPA: sulfotransferase family protein [Candidatus Brocadiaceae bacterium]